MKFMQTVPPICKYARGTLLRLMARRGPGLGRGATTPGTGPPPGMPVAQCHRASDAGRGRPGARPGSRVPGRHGRALPPPPPAATVTESPAVRGSRGGNFKLNVTVAAAAAAAALAPRAPAPAGHRDWLRLRLPPGATECLRVTEAVLPPRAAPAAAAARPGPWSSEHWQPQCRGAGPGPRSPAASQCQ